jgi:hypothetical protein
MKKYIALLITIIIVAIAIPVVRANPLYFPTTVVTATATTSVSYLSAGTGTTTLTVNVYGQTSATNPGTNTGLNFGTLLVQFAGSSTASVLRIAPEYSQDNVDWYQDGGVQAGNWATSTKPFDVSQANFFQFAFSSTSPAGSAVVGATSTRAFKVNVPTHFVRFVFTIPTGAMAGAVWAQFIPLKEVGNPQ